ncbi:RNA polymerase sigma factor [uncultured Sphingomonas sp.]|uniref:RNA polymerase sigma factor n=1 Tax=uncultured Sphingomonas sp. TaxID=158754 RepID=UPI0037498809
MVVLLTLSCSGLPDFTTPNELSIDPGANLIVNRRPSRRKWRAGASCRVGEPVSSDQLVAWVGRHILPHERQLRVWLRAAFPAVDVDDVVQETYCRLSGLDDVAHIDDPRRYFFRAARNVVLEQIRRERVVSIEAASGLAELDQAPDQNQSPEDVVAERHMLSRIERLIDALPDRARQIFRLRKIDGVPQREIAAQLRIPETIVENDVARGLRRILEQLTEEEKAELPIRRRRARFVHPAEREEGGWR